MQSYDIFCKYANFGVSLQHIRIENKNTHVDTVTKNNKNHLLKNNLNNFRANQLPSATGKTIHSVNWIYIAIPLIVIWFSWLSFEYYHIVQDYIATTAMLSGGLIGGLIGGIHGFKQNKKVVRELDEMLRQINDISELDMKKG